MKHLEVSRTIFQGSSFTYERQNTIDAMRIVAIAMLLLLNLRWTLFFSPEETRMIALSAALNADWLWCVLSRHITMCWRCITSLMLFSRLKNRFLFKVCFIKDWQEKFVFHDVLWILMNNKWLFSNSDFLPIGMSFIFYLQTKQRLWLRQAL